MAVDLRPSRVDPLFAADTPITPDPTPGARGSAKGYATREAMIARLVAAGYTAEEAARVVDEELARSGPRPEAMWAQDNSPAGMANLRQGIANQRASERRMGLFEENYNAATGAPDKPSIAPPPMEPDQVPLTAQQLREMGYNPYTEPGVNMPDGTKAARPRQIMTEREAIEYNTRTPNGPGWYNPSGRDEAMMARGYVPVMNPDGTVSYRLGPGGEVDGLPGTPGRGGRREDLEAPLMKADGTPVLDGNGNPVPRFRVENMSGPLSENNSVYVQSAEARAKQAAYMKERQLYQDAKIQGVSPAELLAQSPGDYGDLTAGGQRDRVDARAANEGARQAAAQKREDAWRSQMMLAGRNPAKNAVNAYNALNDPNTNDWQRAVMAERLSPGLQGMTPLASDAVGAQNALRFLNSTNLGAAGLGGQAAQLSMQSWESKQDADAADYAVTVANAMGFDTNGNAWFRSPPTEEDLRRIERRVEARFRGRGARAVAGLPTSGAAPSASTPTASPPPPGGRAMM